MLASALCAWGLAVLGSVPVSTMVLATAPGGMAEMCVTARCSSSGPARHGGPCHAGHYSRDYDRAHVPACETLTARLAGLNQQNLSRKYQFYHGIFRSPRIVIEFAA